MDDQILRFLPEFYAKDDVDSALRHVVDALNNRLQEVRKDLLKVSYSHYVDFASTDVLDRSVEEDLDRIGALYSIKRLIERVSEQEEAAEAGLLREHRALLDRYRERLKATIRIFRDGIATARAIVETVAAVFDLDIVGEIILPNHHARIPVDGSILDVETDEFSTAAVMQRPNRDEAPFLLEVVDNPLRERTRIVEGMESSLPWQITHKGLSAGNPTIKIQAGRDPAKSIATFGQTKFSNSHFEYTRPLEYPVLINRTVGQMIIFNGIIPSEKALIIRQAEHRMAAHIDGKDVSDQIYFVVGSSYDQGMFDTTRHVFLTQNSRFPELSSGSFDYSAFDEAVYHFFDSLALHPFLIPGNNLWEYTNLTDEFVPAEGVESLMKKLVEKPTLFPLEILFQWKERARAAFAVRMPRNISFVISDREKQLFIDTVNSVKAAGVEFLFEPQTLFREQHDTIRDRLTSTHQATSPAQEVHEQEDSFTIGGLLGRTYFNQSVFN